MKSIQGINHDSLKTLNRICSKFNDEFSFILAHSNYRIVQKNIIKKLEEEFPNSIQHLILDPHTSNLYNVLVQGIEAKQTPPRALMVSGLESNEQLDTVIKIMNQMREEFRRKFRYPVVLWVTDSVLQGLIRLAPDFYSWSTALKFESSTKDLLNFIQDTADQVSAKVLDTGSGIFLNN